jgi:hypothetical protein
LLIQGASLVNYFLEAMMWEYLFKIMLRTLLQSFLLLKIVPLETHLYRERSGISENSCTESWEKTLAFYNFCTV